MEGRTIYKAAQIVSRTGEQIEQMLNRIDEFVADLVSESMVFKTSISHNDDANDSSGWLYTSDMRGYGLIKTKAKKKESVQLAFLTRIMDEDEYSNIRNWEPCLYVLIDLSDGEPWEIDNFFLYSAFDDDFFLSPDSRLLVWDEEDSRGAIFVVPLTSISDEVILKEQIVAPAFSMAEKLLEAPLMEYGETPELAFEYEVIDDKYAIV